jgi:hypothetical protein
MTFKQYYNVSYLSYMLKSIILLLTTVLTFSTFAQIKPCVVKVISNTTNLSTINEKCALKVDTITTKGTYLLVVDYACNYYPVVLFNNKKLCCAPDNLESTEGNYKELTNINPKDLKKYVEATLVLLTKVDSLNKIKFETDSLEAIQFRRDSIAKKEKETKEATERERKFQIELQEIEAMIRQDELNLAKQNRSDSIAKEKKNKEYKRILALGKMEGLLITEFKVFDESEITSGTGLKISCFNTSKKTIKYLNFSFQGFNAVDDVVIEPITRTSIIKFKGIGPIESGEIASYEKSYFWFTDIVQYAKIKSISIQYLDGTVKQVRNPNSLIIELEDDESEDYFDY